MPASRGRDLEVHLGVYGMTRRLHRDLQRLRGNVRGDRGPARGRVFFGLNHLLHFYRGQVPLEDYLRLLDEVPALEVRNGTMLRRTTPSLERSRAGRAAAGSGIGGSDAHTLRRVGRPGPRRRGADAAEFLAGLRAAWRRGGVNGSVRNYRRCVRRGGALSGSLVGIGPSDHEPFDGWRAWRSRGRFPFTTPASPSRPWQIKETAEVAAGRDSCDSGHFTARPAFRAEQAS